MRRLLGAAVTRCPMTRAAVTRCAVAMCRVVLNSVYVVQAVQDVWTIVMTCCVRRIRPPAIVGVESLLPGVESVV